MLIFIICQSCLIVLFFPGGWLPFTDLILSFFLFYWKSFYLFYLVLFGYVQLFQDIVYDHLMFLGWKSFFTNFSLMFFLVIATFLFFFFLI